MIPQGYYNAKAVRMLDDNGDEVWAAFGRASTGTQQVLMIFEITDGEHCGEQLPWFGFFTQNAWKRTVESLWHCGFKGDDIDTVNDQDLDQAVRVKIEHETNQNSGQVYARVAFVNASRKPIKLNKPMNRDEIRDFSAMMKSRIAGTGSAQTRPARDPLDDI